MSSEQPLSLSYAAAGTDDDSDWLDIAAPSSLPSTSPPSPAVFSPAPSSVAPSDDEDEDEEEHAIAGWSSSSDSGLDSSSSLDDEEDDEEGGEDMSSQEIGAGPFVDPDPRDTAALERSLVSTLGSSRSTPGTSYVFPDPLTSSIEEEDDEDEEEHAPLNVEHEDKEENKADIAHTSIPASAATVAGTDTDVDVYLYGTPPALKDIFADTYVQRTGLRATIHDHTDDSTAVPEVQLHKSSKPSIAIVFLPCTTPLSTGHTLYQPVCATTTTPATTQDGIIDLLPAGCTVLDTLHVDAVGTFDAWLVKDVLLGVQAPKVEVKARRFRIDSVAGVLIVALTCLLANFALHWSSFSPSSPSLLYDSASVPTTTMWNASSTASGSEGEDVSMSGTSALALRPSSSLSVRPQDVIVPLVTPHHKSEQEQEQEDEVEVGGGAMMLWPSAAVTPIETASFSDEQEAEEQVERVENSLSKLMFGTSLSNWFSSSSSPSAPSSSSPSPLTSSRSHSHSPDSSQPEKLSLHNNARRNARRLGSAVHAIVSEGALALRLPSALATARQHARSERRYLEEFFAPLV